MTNESHLPPDLTALVRDADAIMLATDSALEREAKAAGWDACRDRAETLMGAYKRLTDLSNREESPDLKVADAWLGARCVEAAERLINAAITPEARATAPTLLERIRSFLSGQFR